jgi:hypothetical protein
MSHGDNKPGGTMPYIITTKTITSHPADVVAIRETILSRHAVATLDEARQEANRSLHRGKLLADTDYARFGYAIDMLPESGGTVGPLPDGTVIAVRPIDYLELAGLAGWKLDYAGRERVTGRTRASDRLDLIDAYNAAQEGDGYTTEVHPDFPGSGPAPSDHVANELEGEWPGVRAVCTCGSPLDVEMHGHNGTCPVYRETRA